MIFRQSNSSSDAEIGGAGAILLTNRAKWHAERPESSQEQLTEKF